MTALEGGRDHHVASAASERAHRAVDDAVDETRILQEEIERLRRRVEDLEMTVHEYRSQMSQVLASGSWKLTSPIRAAASRYRNARMKAKRAVKRMRNRRTGDRRALTSGLFMPPLVRLPESSPLRGTVDVNALHRPSRADGPLHRPEGEPTVLVVAHVHYPELWGDIDDRLARMPKQFDLLVTVTEGTAEAAIPTIVRRHPRARIEVVPNRGRDWAPLVRLANMGLLSGYEAVAKVHTKKSEHRVDGDGWRLALLDGVFESPEQIRRTIDLLKEDRSVGLVVPTDSVAGIEHWGSDRGIVEALAYRMGMAFDPEELKFPAGSMFWCRPWLLERLADLDISDEHFELEAGQYDATTAHALERLVGVFAHVAGMDMVESMDVRRRLVDAARSPTVRPSIYSFYLPQYHSIPENDKFWGDGFTDWTNVRKAVPLFDGHRQPILPSDDTGFYDLREPSVLCAHAAAAYAHGIDGFVFHYYWFDGRKVLDTPLNNWLADPAIDLQVALCWANEPWTRRWDGLETDVLVPQVFSDGWADRFWDDISPVLRDPRYIRIEGKPLLLIYRIGLLPDPVTALARWRERAISDGHTGVYILVVEASRDFERPGSRVLGLVDGRLTFPPGSGVRLDSLSAQIKDLPTDFSGDVFSYDVAFDAKPASSGDAPMTCIAPGWDNTARRGQDAYLFLGSNPVTWAGVVREALRSRRSTHPLFVNAWNEWAEGATLESSRRWLSGYARALMDAVGE